MKKLPLSSLFFFALSLLLTLVITTRSNDVFAAVNHVVISEIQVGGGVSNDEFVELYNPTENPISLTNWRLQRKSETGSTTQNLVASMSGTISPHAFFLVGHPSYDGVVEPDEVYSASSSAITINSLVTLYSDAGTTVVDKVGLGTALNGEGTPITNPLDNGSVERKASSISDLTSMLTTEATAGNAEDTDNNSSDFVVRTVSDPQNSQSAAETPIAQTPTPTVTPSGSPTVTLTLTPTGSVTLTISPTLTITQTVTTTATPSPTETHGISVTPTIIETPSVSPSPTATPSPTETLTPTVTLIPTTTASPTQSVTPTGTPTVIPSPTLSLTPTNSPTSTLTNTPTVTPTSNPTVTPTFSLTPTNTATPTITTTPSPTATGTPIATLTPTTTATPTPSVTVTPTQTNTPTVIVTPTPSATPTPTVTGSPTPTPTGKVFGTFIFPNKTIVCTVDAKVKIRKFFVIFIPVFRCFEL